MSAIDDELAMFEAELKAETDAPKPQMAGPRAPKVITSAPMRSAPVAPPAAPQAQLGGARVPVTDWQPPEQLASQIQKEHPTTRMPELGKQPASVPYGSVGGQVAPWEAMAPPPPQAYPPSAQQQADAFMSTMSHPVPPPPAPPASSALVPSAPSGAGPSLSSEADVASTKRYCAGVAWEDKTLLEWPEDDFRIFVGDLGQETNDDVLSHAFARYPSFQMARVVRNKSSGKSMGYGFVSFKDPWDMTKALREMQGRYIGNRPVKVRKSEWKSRSEDAAKGTGREKGELLHSLAISVKSMTKGLKQGPGCPGGGVKKNKYVKSKPKKGMPW